MKKIGIILTVLFLMPLLAAAETQCEFQLSSNGLGLHEGLSVTGEASGSDFDSDTKVEVNCNSGNAEPYVGLPVSATTSAFSASYYPFKARCGYLAVGQDTAYKVTATLLPQKIACTPIGSNQVTVRASTSTSTTSIPVKTGVETSTGPVSAGNTWINQAVPSADQYGKIINSESVQTAVVAPVSACGGLDQIPCEKKTNNWMFPIIYVCNAPYANNGAYPREKARCVACRPGMRYDGGYCVIDSGYKPTPTPSATAVPTAKPSATPPASKPPGQTSTPWNQPPIMGDEATYSYALRAGWNVIGMPWSYGGSWYTCATAEADQIKYYSYNKATQKYETVQSLNANYLRATGVVAYSPVDCKYGITDPKINDYQLITLFKGWNLISVQTHGFGTGTAFGVKNECTITGGPWRYDNDRKQYVRDPYLKPGYGYWIEVKNPFCNLEIMGSENQPPSFP